MRVAITGRTWIRLYVMAVVLLGLVLIAASRGSAQRCWAGDTCTEGCVPYQWSSFCDFNCSAECWPCVCDVYYEMCPGGGLCTDYYCSCSI